MKRFLPLLTACLVMAVVTVATPQPLEAASPERRIKALEAQFKDFVESGKHNKQRLAEALAVFDQVKEDIAAMRGEIQKIRHEVNADATARGSQISKMEHQLGRMEERLEDMNQAVKDVAEFKGKGSESKRQVAERLLYEEAFSELTQKNYKTAGRLFQNFLKKYPKSKLADNAQYWKGECLFAQGDYEKAVLEFQKVIKRYPKGNKAAAAMLKQGYSFVELKAYADGKAFLELVIAKYPKSKEALRAKEKLVEVNKLIKKSST